MSDGLHEAVQAAIATATGRRAWEMSDEDFVALALEVFTHQHAHCAPYRRLCDSRGIRPGGLADWTEIPAVPTEVFKHVDFRTFEVSETRVTFLTSGTSQGTRGRHLLRRADTYSASLLPWLSAFLLPGGTSLPILALAPSAEQDPHSSLSFMLGAAIEQLGAPGSRFFWDEEGPRLDELCVELSARPADQPVLLLGTARALQALCELPSGAPSLPRGSVVMETGGFKGAASSLDRSSFHRLLASGLALPPEAVVSEYGMTELGSQGYQPGWRALHDAEAAARFSGVELSDLYVFPPWCRVRAVDPGDLSVLSPGQRGLLCFWDLSNVDSAMVVLTADEGIVTPVGVRLFGRAPGSTPRGCSLAVDEILAGVSR